MNYVTYPHCCSDDTAVRLPQAGPAIRAIGQGLTVLGGGVLFAATMYAMIVGTVLF